MLQLEFIRKFEIEFTMAAKSIDLNYIMTEIFIFTKEIFQCLPQIPAIHLSIAFRSLRSLKHMPDVLLNEWYKRDNECTLCQTKALEAS